MFSSYLKILFFFLDKTSTTLFVTTTQIVEIFFYSFTGRVSLASKIETYSKVNENENFCFIFFLRLWQRIKNISFQTEKNSRKFSQTFHILLTTQRRSFYLFFGIDCHYSNDLYEILISIASHFFMELIGSLKANSNALMFGHSFCPFELPIPSPLNRTSHSNQITWVFRAPSLIKNFSKKYSTNNKYNIEIKIKSLNFFECVLSQSKPMVCSKWMRFLSKFKCFFAFLLLDFILWKIEFISLSSRAPTSN